MRGADYEIRNSSQEGTQGNRKGAAQWGGHLGRGTRHGIM